MPAYASVMNFYAYSLSPNFYLFHVQLKCKVSATPT